LFAVRLVEGQASHMGRLEVLYDGVWGTVCGWTFGKAEAMVACRSMGYDDGQLLPLGAPNPKSDIGPIWLDGVSCYGDEWALEMCYHNGYGRVRYDCTHKWDAWLDCFAENENHNVIDVEGIEEETNQIEGFEEIFGN
ncbi:hypothetical protein CAPTEDRAFT_96031, partial [Capitella teleta]